VSRSACAAVLLSAWLAVCASWLPVGWCGHLRHCPQGSLAGCMCSMAAVKVV
jgi:hypothetical protein